MSKSRQLKIEVLGDASGAQKAFGQVGQSSEGAAKKIGKTMAIGAAAVGGLAVAGIAAAGKIGQNFDKAFDTIATGTGATGETLSGLEDSFKNVVSNVPTDFGTASEAIANLNTTTGATGEVLEGLTEKVLEASRMLGEDGVANSESFGKAMQQWQIPAEEGEEHLDKLFKLSQDTGAGFGQLTELLTTYGPVLNNAGFEMDEAAVIMGKLEGNGIAVSRIMPGLNSAFRKWADEGKNSREELEKTVDAIANTESSTEALSMATEVFGAEGAQRMVTAIRNGTFALDDLDGALEGAEGQIARTAEETNSMGESWTLFKNRAMVAIEPVATGIFTLASQVLEKLLPALNNMISMIETDVMPVARRFGDWFIETAVPAIREFADTVGNVINGQVIPSFQAIQSTVMPPLQEVIDFVQNNMRSVLIGLAGALTAIVIPAFVIWAATATAAAAATIAALLPVLAPIAALGAAGAALAIAWDKNLGGIQEKTETVVEALTGFFNDDLMPTVRTVRDVIVAVFTEVKEFVERNQEAILEIVDGVWSQIKLTVETMVKLVRDIVQAVMALVKGDWEEAWNEVKEIFDTIKELIIGSVENAKDVILGIFTILRDEVPPLIEAMGGFVIEKIQNLASWMLNEGGPALVGKLIDGLQMLFSTDTAKGVIGLYIRVGSMIMTKLGELANWMFTEGGPVVVGKLVEGLKNLFSADTAMGAYGQIVKMSEFIETKALALAQWMATDAGPMIVRKLIEGLKNLFSVDTATGVVGQFVSLKTALDTKLSELASAAFQWGIDIVQSLIDGIQSKIPDIPDPRDWVPFDLKQTFDAGMRPGEAFGEGIIAGIEGTLESAAFQDKMESILDQHVVSPITGTIGGILEDVPSGDGAPDSAPAGSPAAAPGGGGSVQPVSSGGGSSLDNWQYWYDWQGTLYAIQKGNSAASYVHWLGIAADRGLTHVRKTSPFFGHQKVLIEDEIALLLQFADDAIIGGEEGESTSNTAAASSGFGSGVSSGSSSGNGSSTTININMDSQEIASHTLGAVLPGMTVSVGGGAA